MGYFKQSHIEFENQRIANLFQSGKRNAFEILKTIRASVLYDPDFTRYGKLLRVTSHVLNINNPITLER